MRDTRRGVRPPRPKPAVRSCERCGRPSGKRSRCRACGGGAHVDRYQGTGPSPSAVVISLPVPLPVERDRSVPPYDVLAVVLTEDVAPVAAPEPVPASVPLPVEPCPEVEPLTVRVALLGQ